MAKRIFELARELGVNSKAIVVKCQAEEIPNMNNHMSSVSAGLEATIREWFSEQQNASGTAVETTAHVDLTKVRAKPRARKKAKAATSAETQVQTTAEPVVAAGVSVAVADEMQLTRTADEPGEANRQEPVIVEAAATAPPSDAIIEDNGKAEAPGADESLSAPVQPEPEMKDSGPVMNVPVRPTSVAPAGPKLSEGMQKPAKLSGPKVIRIEAPDQLHTHRPRVSSAPRGGRGVTGGAPPPESPTGDRSSRRNKRRATTEGVGGPGAKRGPGAKTGFGGGKGAGGGGGGGGGKWRQQDLIEREARLSRAGGFLRQRRREIKRKQMSTGERAASIASTGGAITIAAPFSIKDLSSATGVRSSQIIKRLFLEGEMATVNSRIDPEKAQEIMLEYNIELLVEAEKSAERDVEDAFSQREVVDEQPRPPVITILGHVDHGKTSLLDRIRKANVAKGEAGGITQATSAFRVPVSSGDTEKIIVFIDTPGHEAFTAMRARGANMTDIVVLVVAADDGVMPQTVESIHHAQAAGVPIVVALNKIDKPEATDSQIQKIFGELAEQELNPSEWGGQTEVVRTSAETGEGVQDLLEVLDYQAQLLELKADFGGAAGGVVIESRPVEGRGPVANLLVQQGELRLGQFIVAGRSFGRVRDITDDLGKRIDKATPSMPVQVSGLDELPVAGDRFYIADSLKKANEAAQQRRERDRERELTQPKVTLETMFSQMEEAKAKELLVVIKADVQGSVDVLKHAAEDISTDDVKVKVLHEAVGGVTESDVLLADASRAVIIGFNVIPSAKARRLAEEKKIEIRSYRVIYDIVDDLKKAAGGLLEPEIREDVLGHAEVRAVFRISKVGAVAGCYVTDGVIARNAQIRVTRDDIVIEHDRVLEQLKRFKDDAKEVRSGQECGMKIVGYDDIKEGDILECYKKVEVQRTL